MKTSTVWCLLLLLSSCYGFLRNYLLHPKYVRRHMAELTTVELESKPPLHTFTASNPLVGKIESVELAVGPRAKGEVYNIVINHNGKLPYWEGQCVGVIPPGINDKNGKAHLNRLYSIASTRYGDDLQGQTMTLCVRRLLDLDNEEEPSCTGLCSNFLCNSKPGDEVILTGPTGRVMLMPESNPSNDIIMIATGTGIAPFRAYLRKLFVEASPYSESFKSLAWLIAGVANTDSLLYNNEIQRMMETVSSDRLRVQYALSREQTNNKGGKMYVQDRVEENVVEIFDRLEAGAHIYFCGLRSMMASILLVMEAECRRRGVVWSDKQKEWKTKGQWHVEVY